MLLTDIGSVQSEARKQAEKLAVRMQELVNTPICYGDYTIQVTSSIGVHMITPGSHSEILVLTEADNAMYQSKATEKGSITFSDDLAQSEYVIAKIGVRDIDNEHEEIDDLIHSLLNNNIINVDNIKNLEQYIKRHFSSEERLSSELGLNMTAEHIKDHRNILRTITNRDEKNDNYLTKEFVSSVGKLMSQHTFEHDKMLCKVPQKP